MKSGIVVGALVLGVVLGSAQEQPPVDAFHQAIRHNSLDRLRALIAEQGAGVRTSGGLTPLLLASAFGTVDAVRTLLDAGADPKAAGAGGMTPLHVAARDVRKVQLLVDRGADVNAVSQTGATPLIVASSTHGAGAAVTLLLAKGAKVNAADASGLTPIVAAAMVEDVAMVKALLAAGADPTVMPAGFQPGSALHAAAANGNVELIRLLLPRTPDVSAPSTSVLTQVKNGGVKVGKLTPLHSAVASRNPAAVKMLLDAGAAVNAQDIRGLTPLAFAVATDHSNSDIIKLLASHQADSTVRAESGDTPSEWAARFNNPVVMRQVGLRPASSAPKTTPLPAMPAASARDAVVRGLPLLRLAGARMLTDGGCVACHAQPMVGMANYLASRRGWTADGVTTAATQAASSLTGAVPGLLQPRMVAGAPDVQVYTGTMLAVQQAEPSVTTDALVYYLAALQRPDGRWRAMQATRAPMSDGDFTRTAFAIRVLSAYATPALRDDLAPRTARAVSWIASQPPVTNEDRAMQILGLAWGGGERRLRDKRVSELIAQQRGDGGWAQTPHLASDAYATGQALFALHESTSPIPPAVSQKGIAFLLRSQQADGSWHVVNRAMKIQPYFESGFPYGHDQWISHAGSAWAVMGLSVVGSQ